MAQSGRSLAKDVEIRVNAKDNASAQLRRVQASLRAFAASLIARQVGAALESYGRKVISLAEAAGTMAVDFDAAWSKIGVLTGKLGMNLADAQKHVLNLAGATGQAPKDLADSLYFVASAGLKASQVMPVLDTAAKGAAIGLGSLQDIGITLVTTLNAYRGTNLTAAGAMNTLTIAAKASTAEVSDFATGLGPVVGVAAQAGINLQTLSAAISQATTAGIPFARAVTGFRFLIQNLIAPTDKAKDALHDYGFTAQEVYTMLSKPGGLQKTVQLLANTFDLTTAKGREAWRAVTGGARGAIVATTLVGNQTESTNRILRLVTKQGQNMGDIFSNAFERIKKTNPALAIAMLREKIHAVVIELANNFMPMAIRVLQWFNKIVVAFDNLDPRIKDFLARAFLLSGVLALVVGKGLRFIGLLEGMRALLLLTNQSALAVTLSLGGMLAVVGLFIAAGVLVIKNWSTVGPFFIKLFKQLRTSATDAYNNLKKWWDENGARLTKAVLEFAKAVGSFLVAAFKDFMLVVLPIIKLIGNLAILVIPLVTWILKLGTAIANKLNPFLKAAGPLIQSLVVAFLTFKSVMFVEGLIMGIVKAFQALLELKAAGGIAGMLSMFSTGLQASKIAGAATAAKSAATGLGEVAAANAAIRAGLAGATGTAAETAGFSGTLTALGVGGSTFIAAGLAAVAGGIWGIYQAVKHTHKDIQNYLDSFNKGNFKQVGQGMTGGLKTTIQQPLGYRGVPRDYLGAANSSTALTKAGQALQRYREELWPTIAAILKGTDANQQWASQIVQATEGSKKQKISLANLLAQFLPMNARLANTNVLQSESNKLYLDAYLRAGDVAGAIAFLTGKIKAANDVIEKQNEKWRTNQDKLDKVSQKVHTLTGNVIDLGDNIRLLPHDTTVNVNAKTKAARDAVDLLAAKLDSLVRHPYNVDVLLTASMGKTKPRQSGGPVEPGAAYQVGEHHAEWFIPTTSGRISPTLSSVNGERGSGGKQELHVHLHGEPAKDAKKALAEFDWLMRTSGW